MMQKLAVFCLTVLLIFNLSLLTVAADDMELYFNFPREIAQGELFYMTIALPQVQTVDAVQLYLAFDPSFFSFDLSQSWLLAPGLEFNDGHNIFEEVKDANNAGLALIHWQGEYQTDANGTVAQLAFRAKSEAPVSSSLISLVYSANNVAPFVATVESGKIVEKDGFVMKLEVVAPDLPEPQETPIPPGTTGNHQGADTVPGEGEPGSVPSSETNGDPPETSPAPTMPLSTTTITKEVPVTKPTGSKLKDLEGHELFVPTLSPPQSQIPVGFTLEKFKIHDIDIPALHNTQNGKTFYYLKRGEQAGFYSYDAALDAFRPEDLSPYLPVTKITEKKSFDRSQDEPQKANPLLITLIAFIGLASLGLLLIIVLRQLKR